MTNSGEPLVSVGIPTYNRATWLCRSIQSARAQDYGHLEIIISDNCSTDETEAICRAVVSQDPRVRYVRQPVNIGATRNFAKVLEMSSGSYFMWLGDDDWIDDDYISLCVQALLKEPQLALVGGEVSYYSAGIPTGLGQKLSLEGPRGWRRVLAYYSKVRDNGIFYGIGLTDSLRRWPVPNTMGADWLHVAGLAALGRVRMLDTTTVHRELGGATSSYATITRALDLPRWQGKIPFVAIAISAFMDVARRNPNYDALSSIGRLALASAVAVTVLFRSHPVTRLIALTDRKKWRRFLETLRSRLKHAEKL